MPRPPLQNVTLNPPTAPGFVYSPTPSTITNGARRDSDVPGGILHVNKIRGPQRPSFDVPSSSTKEKDRDRDRTPSGQQKDRVPSAKRSTSFSSVKSWGEDLGNVASGMGIGRWTSMKNRKKSERDDKARTTMRSGTSIFGRVLGSWAKDIDYENDAGSESGESSIYNSDLDMTDTDSDADRSISYARGRQIQQTRRSSHETGESIAAPTRVGTTTPDKEFNAWRTSTPSTPRAIPRQTTSSSASVYKIPPPPPDIKRGRAPSLRLGLDIACTVSGADVRGGQEAWCSVTFRGEIDDGDWDVQHCEGGIDVAVVLDISSFSSPSAVERMKDSTIKLLTSLRPETDNIALITVRSRHRRQQKDISPCQTVHFMSPCTPTIIRHLCSVAEGLRVSGSPRSIVREVDFLEAVERAASLFTKKFKGKPNARHVILMTARQPTFDLSTRGTASTPEGGEIPMSERIQLHVLSTSQLSFPETKIPPYPLVPGYILPPTASILDIIPYLRLDLYLTPFSQLTLTLAPPMPTHGAQSLAYLAPFETHILLTHLKIQPATQPGRRDFSGASTTSETYSTLERHLEATLGQLLTPILDVSAYYTPHSNSTTRAAIRRTLRIRRFFAGDDTGVWAEIDRQDFSSEESQKVTRGLAIAMGNRGEEYGMDEDINAEVRYLSTLRGRFNGSVGGGSGSHSSSTGGTVTETASLFEEKTSVRLGSDFRDDATDEAGKIWNEIKREIRRPSMASLGTRSAGAAGLGYRTEEDDGEEVETTLPSGDTSQIGVANGGMGWEKFGPWGV